jgi:uncharacterized membrane protein YadS
MVYGNVKFCILRKAHHFKLVDKIYRVTALVYVCVCEQVCTRETKKEKKFKNEKKSIHLLIPSTNENMLE